MKQTILIGSGVLVLIALLAGAAFVAGGMLGKEAPPEAMPVGAPPVLPGEGEADASLMVEVETSSELPQRPPDVLGVFARREDNRIFVSSSDQGIMFTLDGDVVSEGDAKEVEVVVSGEAAVYEDVTQESLGAGPPSESTIQQKLEPGQVEEIGESSIVMTTERSAGVESVGVITKMMVTPKSAART